MNNVMSKEQGGLVSVLETVQSAKAPAIPAFSCERGTFIHNLTHRQFKALRGYVYRNSKHSKVLALRARVSATETQGEGNYVVYLRRTSAQRKVQASAWVSARARTIGQVFGFVFGDWNKGKVSF